jgi:starvation-inducible DNA-binding protein
MCLVLKRRSSTQTAFSEAMPQRRCHGYVHASRILRQKTSYILQLEKERTAMNHSDIAPQGEASINPPTDLGTNATRDIAAALNAVLADTFALYLKTKNFHWHVSGPHFRDYHSMLDDQGDQLFGMTDNIAERVRKMGGTTLRSIGEIGRLQRILDNDADYVAPDDMLAELRDDNRQLIASMRQLHGLCDDHGDVATASSIENWIDEAEWRVWFLFEAGRKS